MKNGSDVSDRIASFSSSDSTQKTMTSAYRSPVWGSTASARRFAEEDEAAPADLVDGLATFGDGHTGQSAGELVDIVQGCPASAFRFASTSTHAPMLSAPRAVDSRWPGPSYRRGGEASERASDRMESAFKTRAGKEDAIGGS